MCYGLSFSPASPPSSPYFKAFQCPYPPLIVLSFPPFPLLTVDRLTFLLHLFLSLVFSFLFKFQVFLLHLSFLLPSTPPLVSSFNPPHSMKLIPFQGSAVLLFPLYPFLFSYAPLSSVLSAISSFLPFLPLLHFFLFSFPLLISG